MNDKQIIELYWARSERAIAETDSKYGKLCHRIAFQFFFTILTNMLMDRHGP